MPEHPHCHIPELTPLSCAIALGEFVRAEVGKRGVQEFVHCMCRFLPFELCEQLACRLSCEPPHRPPEPHCEHARGQQEHEHHNPPHEPPKKKEMSMEQMMQMMQMMSAFRK
ncbi:MAG: hypothetical protein FWF10_02195 [Clostridiales bacterium]|nr:hypothetical protein [Clostridiales bacterium]